MKQTNKLTGRSGATLCLWWPTRHCIITLVILLGDGHTNAQVVPVDERSPDWDCERAREWKQNWQVLEIVGVFFLASTQYQQLLFFPVTRQHFTGKKPSICRSNGTSDTVIVVQCLPLGFLHVSVCICANICFVFMHLLLSFHESLF